MQPASEWEIADEDLERSLRIWAIPIALVVMRLLVATQLGHFFLRTFFSMWVHETGHAIAAWLCGYFAFPGPWLTPMSTERWPIFALLLFGALAAAAVHSFRTGRRQLGIAACAALLAQTFCTLLLSREAAQAFIYFAGDAGCLVLGALLMATVYAPREGLLHRNWLRWGFLIIGSAAFVDVFEQWWAARTDVDRIPFGRNEGAGLSDPSMLADHFGWSARTITSRYVVLGCVCLVALAATWLAGLYRSRSRASVE
ncbi:MAG: hypothetical protein E6J78_18940 [Deltaproteobacteria bacterium]|nr:MAG: hypothetical protein E6J78_18940 [Deltaproteobacteria bacterium]